MRTGNASRIVRRIGLGLGVLAIAFVSLLAGVGIGASGPATERIVEKKVEVPVEVEVVKVVTQVVEVPVQVERIVRVPEIVEKIVTVEVEKVVTKETEGVVEVTPVPTPTPAGPRIEVVKGTLGYRIQEQNSVWWKFAYQFTLKNNTDRPVSLDIKVKFLDSDGFVVDETLLWGVTVPASEQEHVISDSALIDAGEAPKVAGLKLE